MNDERPLRRLFLPLAVIILLVAAGLRLWGLHQYPPGPHYDEAVNILYTRGLAFSGANFFPMINSYSGKEAGYFYLGALLFRWIGDSPFTLRLTSAFLNLLTIAVTMALGRAMFRGSRGIIVGLAMGLCMTLSFPLLLLSRQMFRAISLPLLQSLSLLLLWRGLKAKNRGWLWLILGGIAGGATLYTYISARLFPLILLLGGQLLIAVNRGARRKRLRQGVIFFAALGAAALPMAVYALQNTDIFFGRLSEVTGTAQDVSLAESIRLHARMLFIEGESLLRYNIPGRPYMTWVEGLFLLAGIGISTWRLWRSRRATERAAYGLALLFPLMLIPSVISVGGFPPNHMRSIGMVPLIFVLVAVGFEALFSGIAPRIRAISPARLLAVLTILTGVIGGGLLGQAYFDWASRPDLFYQTDSDMVAASRWLPVHVDDRTHVYIASHYIEHPTVIAMYASPVTWLGETSLMLPPPGDDGLVIFAHDEPALSFWSPWLEDAQRLDDVPLGPDGLPAFTAYRITSAPDMSSFIQSSAPLRNAYLALVGVQPPEITAGETGEIVMAWRVDQTPPVDDFEPIVQLEDAIGTVLARSQSFILGSQNWQPGETLLHRVALTVPPGTPPGDYDLRVTWVARIRGDYAPYISQSGAQGAVWETIGQLKVVRPQTFPAPEVLSFAVSYGQEVVPGVTLLGWNPPQNSAHPGEHLSLTLFWQGTPSGENRADLSLTARLIGSDENVTLFQGQPVNGRHPARDWLDGELVVDPVRWTTPRDLPAGDYSLILSAGDSEIDLGTVQIAGLPRLFDPPQVQTVIQAHLGADLGLYGYSLDDTDGLRLDLVWHADREADTDYTVFVHVVDVSGAIIAQRDVMPQDNSYPTTLWAAGEYVPDSYTFADLPPGDYSLRVGLYRQSDGQRLPVTSAQGEPSGDRIVIVPG